VLENTKKLYSPIQKFDSAKYMRIALEAICFEEVHNAP
jgi:hypothetical protein